MQINIMKIANGWLVQSPDTKVIQTPNGPQQGAVTHYCPDYQALCVYLAGLMGVEPSIISK